MRGQGEDGLGVIEGTAESRGLPFDDKAGVRDEIDFSGAEWKGDASLPSGRVEMAQVRHTDGVTYTGLRNSDDPDQVLVFNPGEWTAFVAGANDGEFEYEFDKPV
ncbi:DUF397 domain-containing protein [Allokutzneria multivorans]|uniref:DUF397 domain-containing protein n=1 Tax=Allokutzneria multivorans TaxID=1142134 RepID=A0ABP7TMG8_9PSEU